MTQSANVIEQDCDPSAAVSTASRQYEQLRRSRADVLKGNGSFGSASNESKISLNHPVQNKILNAVDGAEQLIPTFKKGDFPGICVIGDQSSGKTSLLEVLCGISLPRGPGLVTRTPLEIALRPGAVVKHTLSYNLTPDNSNTVVTVDITDPNEIAAQVKEATIAVTGDGPNGGKIVDNPLRLEVVGPTQPTLDLTDLPGIVQNVTEHQDESIKNSILQMISRYIAGAMTIIVCVLPATSEPAANCALMLAKEADPERRRTVGVLTMADTAVADLETLNNRLEGIDTNNIVLGLGYYAVYCNAGGESTNPQQWLSEKREKNWFSDHPALSSKRVGTKVLGQDLATQLLIMLLKSNCIGEIKHQVDEHLAILKDELKWLPKKFEDERDAHNFMSDVLDSIASQFKELQKGDYADVTEVRKVRLHLKGFMDQFEEQMLVQCAPSWYLTEDCRKKICVEYNDREGITVTHPMGSVFAAMLHKHINGKLDSLYRELVRNVCQYILDCLKTLAASQLKTYPWILRIFYGLLEEMIYEKRVEALQAVKRLADIAKDTYGSKHPRWTSFVDYSKHSSKLVYSDGTVVELDSDGDSDQDNLGPDDAASQASKVIAKGGRFEHRIMSRNECVFFLDLLDVPLKSQEGLISSLLLLNVRSEVETGYFKQRMELAMHTDVLVREAIDVVPRMVILILSTEVQQDFRKDMRSRFQELSDELLPLMECPSTVKKRGLLDSNIEELTEIQRIMEQIMIS